MAAALKAAAAATAAVAKDELTAATDNENGRNKQIHRQALGEERRRGATGYDAEVNDRIPGGGGSLGGRGWRTNVFLGFF